MKVEDSKYKQLYQKKLSFDFGNFYIFDHYVIGEIFEDAHYNWELAEKAIEAVYDFYGTRSIKVSYISNRVHSYSINAQDWLRFFQDRHHLDAFAIVAYDKLRIMNVVLEKIFFHSRIKKFHSLDDAVAWIKTIQTHTERKQDA